MNKRLYLFWILAIVWILPVRPAMAWGPHTKITQAALEVLPELERWNRLLGEENVKALAAHCLLPDQRGRDLGTFQPRAATGGADPPRAGGEKASDGRSSKFHAVACEGLYPHHLQGICADDGAIYWSFTTTLVKTDLDGKVLKKIPVASHHGDLCFEGGRLYVAVNLGKFNDPQGNADSWVYVYDAGDLSLAAKHPVQEVFHGAGGIGWRDGRFFVVGGLPDGVEENYVYEYDGAFRFVKKHVVKSGHTHLGIQTAAFALGRWWFGCYGEPKTLLVTDAEFRIEGRYPFDCSLGIAGLPDGRFLVAGGRCEQDKGCTGNVRLAIVDAKAGLR